MKNLSLYFNIKKYINKIFNALDKKNLYFFEHKKQNLFIHFIKKIII